MWRKKSEPIPELQFFIDIVISEARYTEVMQFILDPVSIPFILCVMQAHGDEANQLIFKLRLGASIPHFVRPMVRLQPKIEMAIPQSFLAVET